MNNRKTTIVKVAVLLIGSVMVACFLLFSKEEPNHTISLIDENEERAIQITSEDQGNSRVERPRKWEKPNINTSEMELDTNSTTIKVHVCGAVLKPGVYTLSLSARICDAVVAAGGFLDTAAVDYVNQAQKVLDEEQIYIPTQKEVSELPRIAKKSLDGTNADPSKSELVNINKATREELMTLPGLGEAKADMIIKYRESNGPFLSIEDIKNISGIKEGVFSKISDLITTN